MLVQQPVIEFIGNLRKCQLLIDFESDLIVSYDAWLLVTTFSSSNDSAMVTSDTHSLNFNGCNYYDPSNWLPIFSERAIKIGDDDTVFVNDKQRLWIEFAFLIGKHTNKNYLQVLFPSIKSQWLDPMLFDKLINSSSDSIMSAFFEDECPQQAYLVHRLSRLPILDRNKWFRVLSPGLQSKLNLEKESDTYRKFAHTFIVLEPKKKLFYISPNLSINPVSLDSNFQEAFFKKLLALIGYQSEKRIESITLHHLIESHGGLQRLGVIDYFFNANRDQLYSVSSLVARVNRGLPFVMFDTYKSLQSRVLLLPEFLSLWKKEEFRINCLKEVFPNPRKWIKAQLLKQWRNIPNAEYPQPLLALLVRLIDDFYANKNTGGLQVLQESLLRWSLDTLNFDKDDVYFFYGQLINDNVFKEESVLEVLLACLFYKESELSLLDSKIKRLLIWLAKKDPSLVCSCRELHSIYQPLGVGTAFGLTEFIALLYRLRKSASQGNIVNIDQLLDYLKDKNHIDTEAFKKIHKIYRKNGLELLTLNSEFQYTCLWTTNNADWVKGAQLLAGAGFCSSSSEYGISDFFQLLFPDLIVTIDPISLLPVSDYGLNHYIIGDGGSSNLINLSLCKQRYKATGVIFNAFSNYRLSNSEIDRIKYAHYHYQCLFDEARIVKPNQPLFLSTILLIREHVELGCDPDALLAGFEYSNDQMQLVWKNNKTFEARLHQLAIDDLDEFNRLNEYEILRTKGQTTVGKVLKSMDCIAQQTFLLATVPIAFLDLPFRHEIEHKARIGGDTIALMRQKIPRNELRDMVSIHKKAEVLYVSLMTYSFLESSLKLPQKDSKKIAWMSLFSFTPVESPETEVIGLWDCSNRMNPISKAILAELSPLIKEDSWSIVHHKIATILECIIKPELKKSETQEKTRSWLSHILTLFLFQTDVPLFDCQNNVFRNNTSLYEPVDLLNVTKSWIVQQNVEYLFLTDFLDDVLHTLVQPNRDLEKKIRINIKLVKVLEKFSESDGAKFVACLNKNPPISIDKIHVYIGFIAWRLNLEEQKMKSNLLQKNQREYSVDKRDPELTIQNLISKLITSYRISQKKHYSDKYRDYLAYFEWLQSPILPYTQKRSEYSFSSYGSNKLENT